MRWRTYCDVKGDVPKNVRIHSRRARRRFRLPLPPAPLAGGTVAGRAGNYSPWRKIKDKKFVRAVFLSYLCHMSEKKQQPEAAAPAPAPRRKGAKAKKATVKRDISHDLIPLEEETWLLQPIAVTMMRHDYSLIQVRILVSIVENLQNILHGLLSGSQSRQLDIFRSDELDKDGRMPIKMPFKELGVDPNHYPQLRTSLKMLASIPVEIPYKTQEGRKYTKATNLCDVYLPEDRSYAKYAILKIDRSVAERLVSLDFGYHRLGKQIVFSCKNRYTQRIYMFIESWLEKGRAVINPLEFRKMLRLEHNYRKFPDFCRRVLDPARDELHELADKGFCDCWFEYEKQYDHGQRGGEPDKLIFVIHRAGTPLGEQFRRLGEAQHSQLVGMLVQYFGFRKDDAETLAGRVTADIYQKAMQKLMELRERFRQQPVSDRAAYTYKSLDQLIKAEQVPNTEAEEVP